MATDDDEKPEVVLMRPPKPVSEMSDAELDAFADRFLDALFAAKDRADHQDS